MSKKNLKPNVKRARTCVYNCNYHIVFSTKYRRKVLTAEVELKKKLWKGHLWNPSYYIETIGSISKDVIKKYIENQKKI